MWQLCDIGKSECAIEVLNGNFPTKKIQRMNSLCLQRLVCKIVQYSKNLLGAKKLDENYSPLFIWPNNKNIESNLIFSKYKSCDNREFLLTSLYQFAKLFRKNPIPHKPSLGNHKSNNLFSRDYNTIENYKGIKRTLQESVNHFCTNNSKRRKLNDHFDDGTKNKLLTPIIELEDIAKDTVFYRKLAFFDYLKLKVKMYNSHKKTEESSSNSSYTMKLRNCPNVPVSSEMGRYLMNKESHNINEELKLKRIDKTEWFLNKSEIKTSATTNYDVTFKKKRGNTLHDFSFPKRSYKQHKRQVMHRSKYLMQFCRPMTVVLNPINLQKLFEEDQRQVTVLLPKICINDLQCFKKNSLKVVLKACKKQ